MKRYNLYDKTKYFVSFSFEMSSPQQFEIVSLLVYFSRVCLLKSLKESIFFLNKTLEAPEIWLHVKYFQIKGRGEKYEEK